MASNNAFFGTLLAEITQTGISNTFVGSRAGLANTTGNFNAFLAPLLANLTRRAPNTFVGQVLGL